MSKNQNDEPANNQDHTGKQIAWFLAGVAVGAGAALLYAPKSGKETRRYLAHKTNQGREAVETSTQEFVDRSKDILDNCRQLVEDATDLFERGRKLVRG